MKFRKYQSESDTQIIDGASIPKHSSLDSAKFLTVIEDGKSVKPIAIHQLLSDALTTAANHRADGMNAVVYEILKEDDKSETSTP